MKILEAKTAKRTKRFDFKKYQIMGHSPTMANLKHDPFPNKQDDDVVKTVNIGEELVLNGKYRCSLDAFKMENTYQHEGLTFSLTRVKKHLGSRDANNEYIVEIEAVAVLSSKEPIEILAQLRKALCKD